MQEVPEQYTDAVGKVVDRARLKEQLRQFHLDQYNMKNRGLEHSPRFRRNDDLRITGSGDHRAHSPTFPLNARVSGKEKRRRVHAWLGAQVETEGDAKDGKHFDSVYRAKLATGQSSLGDGAGDVGKEEDSGLLHSNSEFVAGYDISPHLRQRENPQTSLQNDSLPNENGAGPTLQEEYPPNVESAVPMEVSMDFTSGGNKYCYVYDPIIARAYTKKYPIDSLEQNTSRTIPEGSALQGNARIKYLPASRNFTPSPAMNRDGRSSSQEIMASSYPSVDLPTKYEEYDMRPIKPLDAGLKKSLYGENCKDDKEDQPPPKPYPRPYLRRSHTIGVTYPTPKSASKSKAHISKISSKVQSSVACKREIPSAKAQQRSPALTKKTGQIRRSPKDALPELPLEEQQDHSQSSETVTSDDRADKIPPVLRELPVDLKHVQAATKIQAVWKGYKTRKLNPKVVEIRQEVRARRAEQYISVLCHEVQCLKENLEAEKKMRDLQTEAIRYIWSQLRMLQKRRNGDKVDGGTKKKASDRRPRSKSSSPRRGVKRANAKSASPRPTTSSGTQKSSRQISESSALDCEEDSDSMDPGDETKIPQKTADASWKEAPDEHLFESDNRRNEINQSHQTEQRAAEDTDEGRGTLVTDGEGNPAHSSAEEEVNQKTKSPHVSQESVKMRATIDTLREQVLQLQEAMLTLTDKMVDQNPVTMNLNTSEEEDLKLVPESQDTSMVCPQQKLDEIEKIESARFAPEPALSARGEVPEISLKNALTLLKSALCENELWALCEQAGHDIKRKPLKRYLALENAFLRKDGRVEFRDIENEEIDEMYLAPEVLDQNSESTMKSSVFSLSVVLWSAADWEMSAEEAPQLTDELESLLVDMSQDDPEKRADIDDVIHICEDHHAKTRVNSLCVCSSIFAEVENTMILSKSGKANQKKIAQEISRDHEMTMKNAFRECVIPDINSCEWQSKLKPVSERALPPCTSKVLTPHEKLMESLTTSSKTALKKSPRPKVFTVRDMFMGNPELVHKLNILPGQRRKNQKAMRLVMRRQFPKDPSSAPKPGMPTPPRALRAGVSEVANASGHSSVILRWHQSKMFDKHGQEAKDEKIIGYRIYVNGHPKGMVAGTKSRALLEGLRHSTEYRVHVRAISSLGESDPSNTVIAHITSRPTSHEHKASHDREIGKDERSLTKTDRHQATASIVPSRKPPQPKPRLGAVFPNQQAADGTQSHDSTSKSDPYTQESSDDVIDRVLRKYGIQQTTTIVPGFASGSTLSPMPQRYNHKSSTTTTTPEEKSSLHAPAKMALPLQLGGGSSNAEKSIIKTTPKSDRASLTSQGSGDATSKSLELLTQLKSELLS